MAVFRRTTNDRGGPFRFRVSDVVEVPLRGVLLRLRLVDGKPSMNDLGVGASLRLRSPDGVERDVRVTAHAVTGGRPTQERLDRVRELDVLIEDGAPGEPIGIGWIASGPAD
jgi:hypothetical protein